MNEREFFVERLKAEEPTFKKVFEALPAERMDYRPHPRSPTAAEIMRTMVAEFASCVELVDTGRTQWNPPPPGGRDEMARDYERSLSALRERVAGLDDSGWQKPGQFSAGGKDYPPTPIGPFLWFVLFDAIHHRGQLTTYIRPMGGKVPGVYGPSADGP
jgi:uncharacterized damage-inducible protein DinB